MIVISEQFQLSLSRLLILIMLFNGATSDQEQDQRDLVDKTRVHQNATISIGRGHGKCDCRAAGAPPHCSKYVANKFALPPEVCLSGIGPHKPFQVLNAPRCIYNDKTWLPATLVTYAGDKCVGPHKVQTLPYMGPAPGCIDFPMTNDYLVPRRPWSLIFHCHEVQANDTLDPFERSYTMGGDLQAPVKPHVPLEMCEQRPPRLTDGNLILMYEDCEVRRATHHTTWKYSPLPIDTCQRTYAGKGLAVQKLGICADGSLARMARYWDEDCRDLYDITNLSDGDLAHNGCRTLNIEMRQIGSIALYCDGPYGVELGCDIVPASISQPFSLFEFLWQQLPHFEYLREDIPPQALL